MLNTSENSLDAIVVGSALSGSVTTAFVETIPAAAASKTNPLTQPPALLLLLPPPPPPFFVIAAMMIFPWGCWRAWCLWLTD